jgi:hypothetical protein
MHIFEFYHTNYSEARLNNLVYQIKNNVTVNEQSLTNKNGITPQSNITNINDIVNLILYKKIWAMGFCLSTV